MAVKDREASVDLAPEATDYRKQRMPSAEGVRRAWAAYQAAVTKIAEPAVRPLAQKAAGALVVDLAGFWLTWHLEGGFEGLQRIGMSRASIYRRVKLFRKFFGAHPDEFEFPGVQVNVVEYLKCAGKTIGPRDTH